MCQRGLENQLRCSIVGIIASNIILKHKTLLDCASADYIKYCFNLSIEAIEYGKLGCAIIAFYHTFNRQLLGR